MITVCPNDGELLAIASGDEPSAQVKSHLQECSRCLRKLSGLKLEMKALKKAFGSTEREVDPSPAAVWDEGNVADKSAQTTSEPKRIGKYVVVGALGSGGQGSVYRALHPTLQEQVVLKVSARRLDNSASAKNDRLIAEGRILCQLKHPNIGRIYDLDFFEHRPFLVMEYVRGRSLDRYARDRVLTSPKIAALMAKVARGLDAAHRFGIVHQDVKPQNIIIDEKDEPKLIDFGMARLHGTGSEGLAQPLGGTIAYMSPEQARSDSKRITGLSDVFALGAVLYFLITDKPPFGGPLRNDNLLRATKCEFDRGALEKAEALPRLKQIALKALSAEPEDRFASVKEMAEALESLDRATIRRRRIVSVIPVLLVLAAAVATAWWWPRPGPIPPSGQLLITQDGQSELALPLMTGQNLRFEGRVQRDVPAVVFWVGSGGQVFRQPAIQVHDEDQFDHVFSPGKARTTAVAGHPGTEFILMVARSDLGDARNIDALQSELRSFFADHSLAELPPTGAVLVDASGARVKFLDGARASRDPGGGGDDSCAAVSTPLDELGRQLKERKYFFAGIAVPHQDAHD